MKIAVLCGGRSSERDVSLSTGIQVARALRETGHDVVLVDAFVVFIFRHAVSYDAGTGLDADDSVFLVGQADADAGVHIS